MKYRYVPMLRAKAGEGVALTNLDPMAKARMFPVVHLAKAVPATFSAKAAAAWTGLPMALDGSYHEDINGNISAYLTLFDTLGRAGVLMIPSLSCSTPASYNAAVTPLIGRYAPGVVIKADLSTISGITSLARSIGLLPNNVDIVIDLEDISAVFTNDWTDYVGDRLTKLPNPTQWRSITLASSAAPKDYGSLNTGRNFVKRNDWKLWRAVHGAVSYRLDYGDYATLHPNLTEPPGAAMARATVSVRYTIENNWIVYKGTGTSGAHGQPMGVQYLAHARALSGEAKFGCLVTAWADNRISQIAAGASNPGSRTTWAENGINRHLALVAAQLP